MVPGPSQVLIMPNQAIGRAYRVTAVPQIVVVSPVGTLQWVHIGSMTPAIRGALMAELRKPTAAIKASH